MATRPREAILKRKHPQEGALGAVSFVFRTELRRRWRSWLILASLISITGGFVLAAAAAGRRTESAFPGFAAAHGFDVLVNAGKPEPKIAKLPGVTSATELVFAVNGQPTCHCTHPINGNYLYVGAVPARGEPPFKLASGHMPDRSAPDQVLASFTLQQDDGVQLGTVIHVPLYSTSQASADSPGPSGVLPRPKGPSWRRLSNGHPRSTSLFDGRWAASARRRSPNRPGRDDHASSRCPSGISRPRHFDGALGCYSDRIVPGGLPDFLSGAGRNRQPGYWRAVHEYWL